MRAFVSLIVLVLSLKRSLGLILRTHRNTQQNSAIMNTVLPEDTDVEKPFQFHVAPMQCYTNESMRQLYRALSPDAVLWTEMEKVPDLISANAAGLERRFGTPGFKDIVLQLGGNDPASLKGCLERLSDFGYSFSEINLNCGCPSIEAGGGATFGASLMKDPDLTRELLATISENKRNERTIVSLKCRVAVAETTDELLGETSREDSYQRLHHYVSEAEQGGISHLVLHARAAVLSGLSPTKNRKVPPLDYKKVERVAGNFPFKVTLNGGINSISQLKEMTQEIPQSVISSYMAGRWMLRRPLDLAKIQHEHSSHKMDDEDGLSDPSEEAIRAVKNYTNFLRLSVESPKSSRALDELCLPLFLVTEQLREDYDQLEEQDMEHSNVWLCDDDIERMHTNIAETVAWLQEFRGNKKKNKTMSADIVDLKKLSLAFKGIVGTKVANKWKRNRAEL
jgi:tRNA dihydrouridine synthase A